MPRAVEVKPCRVCGDNDINYPPSRLKKKDWICTPCSNGKRKEWWARYRAKKRELANYERTGNEKAVLEAQLEFLDVMDDKPECSFCFRKLTATRRSKDYGKPLMWQCLPCNDLIIAKVL